MKKLSSSSRRFLIWLTIIIVGLVGIEFTLGLINEYFMNDGRVRIDAIEHLLLDADEDILIMGNSAAACHFEAAKIEKKLGKTCFNAGTMGSSLRFNLVALKGLVSHHRPRLIILALNPANFTDTSLGKTTISFPSYYGKAGDEFDRAVDSLYPNRSKFLRLNVARTDRNIFRRLAYKSGLVSYPFEKGFQPLPNTARHVANRALRDSLLHPDPRALQDIEDFIRITREHKIPLIITLTPNCVAGSENDEIYKLLPHYADGKSVILWNDTRLFPPSESERLFFDLLHLNARGAGIYTDTVIRRLASFPPL